MARTLLALLVCFFSIAALAVDLERKVDFNIPAQTLSAALIQFSHQAKIQVVISDDISQQTTQGITGARHHPAGRCSSCSQWRDSATGWLATTPSRSAGLEDDTRYAWALPGLARYRRADSRRLRRKDPDPGKRRATLPPGSTSKSHRHGDQAP